MPQALPVEILLGLYWDIDRDFPDINPKGSIEYLALGSRAAGLGPTLPPGNAAIAITADPPHNASPGDMVQVWTDTTSTSPSPSTPSQLVTTAELRGTAGDIVTIVVDEVDATQLDPEARYRLVTLPLHPRIDREFAAQLRAAEETLDVITITPESILTTTAIGALDITVVALQTADGDIVAIPNRTHTLAVGDSLFAIGRPDRLRTLETAAAPPAAPIK